MPLVIEIVLAVFGLILTILGTLLLSYFKDMKQDIKAMSTSMIDMNLKMEKVVADQSWHKDEIQEIKENIKILFGKVNDIDQRE